MQNSSRSGVGGWKPCRRRGFDATPPWISLSLLRKESRRRTDDPPQPALLRVFTRHGGVDGVRGSSALRPLMLDGHLLSFKGGILKQTPLK